MLTVFADAFAGKPCLRSVAVCLDGAKDCCQIRCQLMHV